MKARYSTALALVSWYLMVPPSAQRFSDLATGLDPLWQWLQIGSFDSANACQQGRRMMIDHFMADLQRDPNDAGAVHSLDAFYYSECIASDDPRLQTKMSHSTFQKKPLAPKITPTPNVRSYPN
jgi:hypothetical protein